MPLRTDPPHTIQGILHLFTYTVGSLLIIIGILLVSGVAYVGNFPSEVRVMFGIVIMLYGLYRIVTTYTKRRNEIDLPL